MLGELALKNDSISINSTPDYFGINPKKFFLYIYPHEMILKMNFKNLCYYLMNRGGKGRGVVEKN